MENKKLDLQINEYRDVMVDLKKMDVERMRLRKDLAYAESCFNELQTKKFGLQEQILKTIDED